MKIRITSKKDEVEKVVQVLEQSFEIISRSAPYPQTRYDKNSQLVAVYIECEIK